MSANKYESSELEGSGASKLVQLIKQGGYNKDVNVEIGTVVSAPPNLKIKIERDDIILEKDDLTVAEHLTRHTRVVTFRKQTKLPDFTTKIRLASDNVSESMTPEGLGPHVHDITQIDMDNVQDDFEMTELEIQFDDELRVGNRVFIVVDDDSQEYYVIDRAVSYDGNNA